MAAEVIRRRVVLFMGYTLRLTGLVEDWRPPGRWRDAIASGIVRRSKNAPRYSRDARIIQVPSKQPQFRRKRSKAPSSQAPSTRELPTISPRNFDNHITNSKGVG